MSDEHLQRFATAVVELQEKKQQRMDEQLSLQVARELGMTEEELQQARAESAVHKTKAQALRSAGNLDDAITELEVAHGFNPLDIEIMYMLSDALFTRSLRTKNEEEWRRAKALCLGVLDAAPAHKDAPSLLNAINNKDPTRQTDNSFPIAIVIGVGAFVVIGAIALLALML